MNSIATELSNSIAAAVERASSGIVRVAARRHLASTGIVWSNDVIVTASHTVHDETSLVGRDEATDVAVLRVDKSELTPIEWSDTQPRVGEIVIAAGRPGRDVRAAIGFVAGIDKHLEVDGRLPPGFSGGPLLASDGRALGMNTSRLARGGTTIPIETLRRIVPEILAHGSTRRPFLGVGVYPVKSGLVVLSVQHESAAARAGVIVGDVIESPRDLRDAVNGGGSLTLNVRRGGEPRAIEVAL